MDNLIIKVEHVSKTVDNRQLLDDVSFEIAEQSLVSLIGPNGAGKSTLVKIILGLDDNYEGSVSIADNQRIQYIPQLAPNDKHQLPLSVREYIKVGTTSIYSRTASNETFADALAHVGVKEAVLDQPFTTLSGGERQRVAIARALLVDPTVLVLDEPLAAVDFASRNGLYELIRHLQQDHKMTVLLVSHDIDSVMPLSDRVLCLNKRLHTNCHPSELNHDHAHQHAMHHNC